MSVSVSGHAQPYLVYQLLQPQWQAANPNSAASAQSSPTGAASSVSSFGLSGGVAISAAVAAFLSGLGSDWALPPDPSTASMTTISSPTAPIAASSSSSSSSFSADLTQQGQGDSQAPTGAASPVATSSDPSAAPSDSPSADLAAAVAAYVSVMQSAPSSGAATSATTHPGNPAQSRDHALPPVG